MRREEAAKIRASGGNDPQTPSRDEEQDACLRSATVKYLRGSMSPNRFYEDISLSRLGGKRTGAVVARMAKGMPEEKASALMEVYRDHKREERLSRQR
ncbi:unnamed protein product [Ascophyllum nodosum]